MQPRTRGALQGLALLVGVFVALFTVGVSLFEGPSSVVSGERTFSYLLVAAAYALGALLLARATGTGPWRWLAWYASPAYVLILLFTVKDKLGQPEWLLLHLVYAVLVTVATVGGGMLGMMWARRARPSPT